MCQTEERCGVEAAVQASAFAKWDVDIYTRHEVGGFGAKILILFNGFQVCEDIFWTFGVFS